MIQVTIWMLGTEMNIGLGSWFVKSSRYIVVHKIKKL